MQIVSLTKEITIYNNISLVRHSNFVAAITFYLHVFNIHSIKNSCTFVKVIFDHQTKVTWRDMPALILGLFYFSEGLD